jgi:hypothetical protein
MEPNDKPKTHQRPRWGQGYSRLTVEKIIHILAHTYDVELASKETGVAERTINRWLQLDDKFNEKLHSAQLAIYQPGYTNLRVEFPKTVSALVKMRDNPNVSDAVRLGAMRTLMEYASQVYMLDHYDKKLKQLEARTINAVDDGAITTVPETSNAPNTPNTPEWWKDPLQDQPQDWQQ